MGNDRDDDEEPEVRFLLRLPESLHAAVKKRARQDDRSMQKTLVHAARLYVKGVTGD